ncbi:MAG: tetratricopeptide repeat protein [Bacteroidia bacterium]|nr:tetratricopeptide repeat protein [Bacteroidia bacterium]
MEPRDLELLSEYLAGGLDAAEVRAVEERLRGDAAFAAALAAQQERIAILQAAARAGTKSELRAVLREADARQARVRVLWAGAAALAAVLLVLLLIRQPKPDVRQLALAAVEPYPIGQIRGVADARLPDSVAAAYQAGRCAEAQPALQALIARHPEDPLLRMYAADCFTQTGQYAEALRLLRSLQQDPLLADAAGWRIALNEILAGGSPRALLDSLARSPHYKAREAARLRDALP